MKDFSLELKEVPEKPGVYLMRNETGEIIYVGKAINLKRRVSSYFRQSRKNQSPKVRAMVEHVDRFEYIVVKNEVEALVLESNFIKEHEPKYNILLRDDKQYPYICITKEAYPRIVKVRRIEKDGGDYYGPYPNAYAVNDVIRLLQRVYKIRTCRLDFDRGQALNRPCLNYFIDQCPAPCVGKADPRAYQESIEKARDFLKGKDQPIRALLTGKMEEASDQLHFERAAGFRDDLYYLDQLKERQTVSLTQNKDADVIAFARSGRGISVQVLFVRSGKVVDRLPFRMEGQSEEEGEEIISSFLKQFYLKATYVPPEIFVEAYPEDRQGIEDFLSEKRGSRVKLLYPQRGDKRSLLEMAKRNAQEERKKIEKRQDRKEGKRDRGLSALEEALGLSHLVRLEAYDISNLSGVQNVGSMVVYYGREKQPKEYRKFKIRTVEGADDYASHREMLSRRLDHGLEDRRQGKSKTTGFAYFPDLILMDGGKGQVNLAEDLVAERGLDIPVAGMVKDDKHKTRALYFAGREIPLSPSSPLYRFLYEIQEEVHRFAIHYHRKLRDQSMLRSELDEVKGIGKARKKALMQAFGSLSAMKEASQADLAAVEGMNQTVAGILYTRFHLGAEEGSSLIGEGKSKDVHVGSNACGKRRKQ